MSSALSPPKLATNSKQVEIQLKKMRDLENDVKEFQAHISRLELEKADLRKQNVALSAGEGKRSALESRLFSLREELENEKKKSAAEAACAQRTKSETEVVIAKWQEAESGWVTENAQLQDSVRRLTSIESSLRSEVDHLKAKATQDRRVAGAREADIADLHASLNELRSCHEAAKCENQAMSSRLVESVAEKARQRDYIDVLRAEVAQLTRANAKFQEDIASLEEHLEQRNHLVNSLRNENSDLENQRDELTAQRNKLNNRCEFLAQESETLHSKLSVMNMNIEEAQNAISHRDRATSEFVAERAQLNEQLQEHRDVAARLTAANHQYQRQVEEMTRDVAHLRGELTALQADHQTAQSTCAHLQEQLIEHRLLIVDLKEENAVFLAAREAADQQHTQLVDGIDTVSAERALLQAELGAVRTELDLVRAEKRGMDCQLVEMGERCQRLALENECNWTQRSEEVRCGQCLIACMHGSMMEAARLHHQAIQDCATATARIDALNTASASLAEEVAAAHAQCAQLELDNTSIKLELATMQEQQSREREVAARNDQQLVDLVAEVAVLRDQNTVLTQSSENLVAAARTAALSDAEHRIKAVETMASKEREVLQIKFNTERDSVMVLRGKLAASDKKVDEQSEKLLRYGRDIEASNVLCKSLQVNVADLTQANERLKLHVNKHKLEADNAIENKQKYKDEFVKLLASYNEAVDANQRLHAHLKDTVGRANTQCARLQAAHVDARDKLEEVLKRVKASRETRRAAQPEYDMAVVALDQLTTILNEKEPIFTVDMTVEGKTAPANPQHRHMQEALGGVNRIENRPAPIKRSREQS